MSQENISILCIATILAPLLAAIFVGFLGTNFKKKPIKKETAHYISIFGISFSLILSIIIFINSLKKGLTYDFDLYLWNFIGNIRVSMGILIDSLSSSLMILVNIVSLVVHIYTIGYMKNDDGYQRFFSYISLFTFFMLVLITSNNLLQLFFGWEGVGLVSYLLIGFWYKRPLAISANLKAFLVNRIGDLFFILGIALLFSLTNTMHYKGIFDVIQYFSLNNILLSSSNLSIISVVCFCLLIGAIAKSAQIPLHVWLPDSMEGPTPISALIHSATMVTAGIFLVTRLSPIFELSTPILSLMLIIGSLNIIFLGILGIIQYDIKRIIAYSTLSQLGYMFVALGASAYPAAIFHLITHAFFKALLFLCAGSLIISMHHNQDIRGMGGLKKHMPITWITFLIGTLSLVGAPFLSGFYSKENIIEIVKRSDIYGSSFAYYSCLLGILITSLYSFRLYFLVFHGKENFKKNLENHFKSCDSSLAIAFPLIFLAIVSTLSGMIFVNPILFGDFFKESIFISREHLAMSKLINDWPGFLGFSIHSIKNLSFWFTCFGALISWYGFLKKPEIIPIFLRLIPLKFQQLFKKKYYIDWIYEDLAIKIFRGLGSIFLRKIDKNIIDKLFVSGGPKLIIKMAYTFRRLQTGHIHWYALSMIIGTISFLTIFLLSSS